MATISCAAALRFTLKSTQVGDFFRLAASRILPICIAWELAGCASSLEQRPGIDSTPPTTKPRQADSAASDDSLKRLGKKIYDYEHSKPSFHPPQLTQKGVHHPISQLPHHVLSAAEAGQLRRAGITDYALYWEDYWWGHTYWFYFFYRNGNSFSFDVHTDPKPGGAAEDTASDQPPGTKSANLTRDIKAMWATTRLHDEAFASTGTAIAAADRVFNTVSLVGKTREEVVALLGDPHTSNNSQYNFPFWPAPKGAMVYRFDCGAYGWQFNILFDRHAKVKSVERKWIH